MSAYTHSIFSQTVRRERARRLQPAKKVETPKKAQAPKKAAATKKAAEPKKPAAPKVNPATSAQVSLSEDNFPELPSPATKKADSYQEVPSYAEVLASPTPAPTQSSEEVAASTPVRSLQQQQRRRSPTPRRPAQLSRTDQTILATVLPSVQAAVEELNQEPSVPKIAGLMVDFVTLLAKLLNDIQTKKSDQ